MKIQKEDVQTKKLDESRLAFLIKELHSSGELIRVRQEEKQSIIDEYNSESKRFFLGKLSERTVKSSIKKTRDEIKRIDSEIRNIIKQASKKIDEINKLILFQKPHRFKINYSGAYDSLKKKVKGGKK